MVRGLSLEGHLSRLEQSQVSPSTTTACCLSSTDPFIHGCIEVTSDAVATQLVDKQGMTDLIEGIGEVENNGVLLVSFLHFYGRLVSVAQELRLT